MAQIHGSRIVTDGLVLYFDAGNTKSYPSSGTAIYDLSRNGYNGELINNPIYSSNNSGSLSFNGSNNYIGSIENPNYIEPAAITVAGWINMDTDASTARHIWLTKWYGYSMEIEATSRRPYFRLYGPGDTYSSVNLILGDWYYIAGTYDTSLGAKFYLNGVEKGSKSTSTAISYSRDWPLNIGRYSGGIYFKGKIAAVQIYNRTLSPTEILQNYNALRGRFGL